MEPTPSIHADPTPVDPECLSKECGLGAAQGGQLLSSIFEVNMAPISANAMYRIVGRRLVMSARGRKFMADMSTMLDAIAPPMVDGPVRVTITFSFSDRRRRDVDNFAKGTLDAIKNRMFGDDSLIMELHLHKVLGAPKNKILIQVTSI